MAVLPLEAAVERAASLHSSIPSHFSHLQVKKQYIYIIKFLKKIISFPFKCLQFLLF